MIGCQQVSGTLLSSLNPSRPIEITNPEDDLTRVEVKSGSRQLRRRRGPARSDSRGTDTSCEFLVASRARARPELLWRPSGDIASGSLCRQAASAELSTAFRFHRVDRSASAHCRDIDAVWRALANPVRRQLLDSAEQRSADDRRPGEESARAQPLRRHAAPGRADRRRARRCPSAGQVPVQPLNPVPLRRWYERWVVPMADGAAAEMLALERAVSEREPTGGQELSVAAPVKAGRVPAPYGSRPSSSSRPRPSASTRFSVERSSEWFPTTYGEERVKAIVLEPRIGGAYYEDWGEGRGHLYGTVTRYDPPFQLHFRGRLDLGTILDTEYTLEPAGDETILRVSKVAVGPFTDEEAAGINKYGDLARFEDALRRVIEGAAGPRSAPACGRPPRGAA